MPLNSPGYDCRVTQILGDWMVSIPSVIANPNLDINAVPDDNGVFPPNADTDVQPYMEVPPDDPGYADAVRVAGLRLNQYHTGRRYTYCPDTSDILDPLIEAEADQNVAVTPDVGAVFDPTDPNKVIMPDLGIPLRPHWVVTDTTEAGGDWFPRRPDWDQALVSHVVVASGISANDLEDVTDVVNALEDVTLTPEVRAALTAEVPFGMWKNKSTCQSNFVGVPTVADFTANRPSWMPTSDPTAPVYTLSPGAAVFGTICFNCHGPNADSQGLLADEITLMTGGDARVANFRDGLFGPRTSPGDNRSRVFGPDAATLGVTADDLASRYLAWMALGGTAKHLPTTLLAQVSLTPVLGQLRGPKLQLDGTPDMLRLGLKLCAESLPAESPNVTFLTMQGFLLNGRMDWSGQGTGLIDSNGDADMWMRLCNLNNRPVVRVLEPGSSNITVNAANLYWGEAYPAGAPVLNHKAQVVNGLTSDNLMPICVHGPNTGANAIMALGVPVPSCPDVLFAKDGNGQLLYLLKSTKDPNTGVTDYSDARKWAARGAINAALAVFLYVDQLEKGQVAPKPPYDQCEQLGHATTASN
jgi:hypothetical protein